MSESKRLVCLSCDCYDTFTTHPPRLMIAFGHLSGFHPHIRRMFNTPLAISNCGTESRRCIIATYHLSQSE